jgi:S-DNA-T family DNA segregation ATPase FtsK/SpoIIIE
MGVLMTKNADQENDQPRAPITVPRILLWLVLTASWLVIVAALASYDPADPPGHSVAPHHLQPTNWMGWIGATIAHEGYLMLGPGIWILAIGGAVCLITLVRRNPIEQPAIRSIGLLMMCIFASAMVSFGMPGFWSVGQGIVGHRPEGAGGLLAIFLTDQLLVRFNHFGTILALGLGFVVGIILAADQIVLAMPRWLGTIVLWISRMPRPQGGKTYGVKEGGFLDRFKPRTSPAASTISVSPGRSKVTPVRKGKKAEEEPEFETDDLDIEQEEKVSKSKSKSKGKGKAGRRSKAKPEPEEEPEEELDEELDLEEEDEYEYEVEEDEYEYEEEEEEEEEEEVVAEKPAKEAGDKNNPLTAEALREKIKNLPIRFAPKQDTSPVPQEMDLSGYSFPSMDLLIDAEGGFSDEQEKQVRDQAMILESALTEFGIDGEVVAIDSGPVITLYEIRLAPGTKVNRVSAVSSDVARSLKAHNIRIVPNMAGKDTIGIEVPNLKKERVRLKELMLANHSARSKMRLPMYLGKDASGNPLIADLGTMPHMLIAGTTGSGKSVCMNSIIMSFLFTKRPDELKLVLVDPKMVEMSMFKNIPHLMCPVVTEMNKAAAILEWAVRKMDERYELLAEAGVRDIMSYNGLGEKELLERLEPSTEAEEARIPKKLPFLVFVIDELADLMMTNKEVESDIVRIAQKARAVGIHLILATQRPQANVVTGLIKSNMPCRISFKVSSGMDSRIVLDQKGAELLLGQGDMLFLSPQSSKLTRSQGTLVDDEEVRKVVKHLKEVSTQQFEPQLVQLKQPGVSNDEGGERDELFDEAVRVVLESQRGSVSLLQRRLTIGYGRSSRLIEEIANAGIIGQHKGSQAREVNFSLEEWDALKAQAEADAQNPAVDVHALASDVETPEQESAEAGTDIEAKSEVEVEADEIDEVEEEELEVEIEDEYEEVELIEQAEEATEEEEEEEDSEDEDDEVTVEEAEWEDEWEEEEKSKPKAKSKSKSKSKSKGKSKR